MTNEQLTLKAIENSLFLYTYKQKNKKIKQLYKVDLSKEFKLNGLSEKGFGLTFWPELTDSCSCITYVNIMQCIRLGQIKIGDNITIHHIPLKEVNKHYFTPSESDSDFCAKCGNNFRDTKNHITVNV